MMKKYIIVNTNKNRYAPFFFAEGDYVTGSDGSTSSDITHSRLYRIKTIAMKQADKLNKKFDVDGDWYRKYTQLGRTIPDPWKMFVPTFEVKTVEVEFNLVELVEEDHMPARQND